MSDEPKPVSVINVEELVKRINQAKRLRAEGANEEDIKSVEPSEEEMRQVLLELRQGRTEINTKTKSTAKKPRQPKTLDGLLGEPLK